MNTGLVHADSKTGRRVRRIIPDSLILSPGVQEELKLTKEQKAKVREVHEAVTRGQAEATRGAINPEAPLDVQALMTMIANQQSEKEAAFARILTPRQRARLAQIAVQLEGPEALVKPEVATQLKLGPDQVEMIQAIIAEMGEREAQLTAAQAERARALQGDGQLQPDRKEVEAQKDQMAQATERIQAEAVRQINRVLTRRQQLAYKKLLGEPFDVSRFEAVGDRAPRATPRTEGPRTPSATPPTGGQPTTTAPGTTSDRDPN
jgi:Spy/CpxP family protein refolding chaperone